MAQSTLSRGTCQTQGQGWPNPHRGLGDIALASPCLALMPYAVSEKTTFSPHFQLLRAMHEASLNYIAYVSVAFIAFLVVLDILIYWYRNVLKLRLVDFSLLLWHCASRTLQNLLLKVLFRFVLLLLVPTVVLVILCEKREIKLQKTSFEPRVWLLGLTLWNALSIEVCLLCEFAEELANRT